jgi:hypothetical protein
MFNKSLEINIKNSWKISLRSSRKALRNVNPQW